MSNLVIPDVGKIASMKRLANVAAFTGGYPAKLRLFKASLTIGPSLTRATLLANEANFSGYPAGGVTMTNPAVSGTLDSDNRAVAQWDAITFTKSGATGNDIYGYWMEDFQVTPEVIAAEQFDASVPLNTNGAFLIIVPRMTDKSQYVNV